MFIRFQILHLTHSLNDTEKQLSTYIQNHALILIRFTETIMAAKYLNKVKTKLTV